MTDSDDLHEGAGGPVHRIGAVSRLSGVPVTTLRVWEARYAAFSPGKSAGRHRLYTEADVIRARLIRQLAAAGHGVGAIAALPSGHLQQMWAAVRDTGRGAEPRELPRIRAAIVGAGLAVRVNAPEWRDRLLRGQFEVVAVHASLEALQDAAPDPAAAGVDILLVRLNALHDGTHAQLARATAALRPQRVIVLYNFAAQRLLASMQADGVMLRREPLPDAELADLIRSVVLVDPVQSTGSPASGVLIPARRYSDATLARIAASPTDILCECPRHIVDIISQLASFEEYSRECLNTSTEDARLHAQLRSVAGSARAMFEHALEMVAQHGGVEWPQDDAGGPAA